LSFYKHLFCEAFFVLSLHHNHIDNKVKKETMFEEKTKEGEEEEEEGREGGI
jgi:hypothetical protein